MSDQAKSFDLALGLSSLADRKFVVAYLLPVLFLALAGASLFPDTIRYLYESIVNQKSFTEIAIPVFAIGGAAIWVAATLMMICNKTIFQVLEGYIGPFNRKSWRERMCARFMHDRNELRNMHHEEPGYIPKYIMFRLKYPHDPSHIMPTQFGNAIRAFETYPLNVYGVDLVATWPRLAAVVPKDFAEQADYARAEVSFWVNIWLMALLFACLSVARLLWGSYTYAVQEHFRSFSIYAFYNIPWRFAALSMVGVAAAVLAYRLAIDRVQEWGDLIKSAFDLYLPTLAKTLGYDLPPTREEQLLFWDQVMSMFYLHQPLHPERWRPAGPTDRKSEGNNEEATGKRPAKPGPD